jgi:hypothetical protein
LWGCGFPIQEPEISEFFFFGQSLWGCGFPIKEPKISKYFFGGAVVVVVWVPDPGIWNQRKFLFWLKSVNRVFIFWAVVVRVWVLDLGAWNQKIFLFYGRLLWGCGIPIQELKSANLSFFGAIIVGVWVAVPGTWNQRIFFFFFGRCCGGQESE